MVGFVEPFDPQALDVRYQRVRQYVVYSDAAVMPERAVSQYNKAGGRLNYLPTRRQFVRLFRRALQRLVRAEPNERLIGIVCELLDFPEGLNGHWRVPADDVRLDGEVGMGFVAILLTFSHLKAAECG